MSVQDNAIDLRRFQQEIASAQRASSPETANIHLTLARAYQARMSGSGATLAEVTT